MKKIFLLLTVALLPVFSLRAADSTNSLYDIPLKDIDGNAASLKPFQGKVLLIVNVASHCGFTPQYTALETIYEKYKDQGLVICGFPCNQFAGQEPGTDAEIKQFCTAKYNVTFPMFDKLEVNGKNRHPLYVWLFANEDAHAPHLDKIPWNFTKFLVGRDGKVLNHFVSKVKPDSPEVTQAIEAALDAK